MGLWKGNIFGKKVYALCIYWDGFIIWKNCKEKKKKCECVVVWKKKNLMQAIISNEVIPVRFDKDFQRWCVFNMYGDV